MAGSFYLFKNLSGKGGSNSRPSAWEADALPLSYSRLLEESASLRVASLQVKNQIPTLYLWTLPGASHGN